jgi:hypothetical protein
MLAHSSNPGQVRMSRPFPENDAADMRHDFTDEKG